MFTMNESDFPPKQRYAPTRVRFSRSSQRSWRLNFCRVVLALVVGTVLSAPTTAADERRTHVLRKAIAAAALQQSQPIPDYPEITSYLSFGWPAVGRIILGFCGSSNHKNTGINLAVLPNTDVRAVEAGQIAYAGDELTGFRNLILISHGDGWLSAYANNDQGLVKRGDLVERGQVIGRTGKGESPRLHFELRRNGAPVDPMLYLDDASAYTVQMTRIQCRG
jgi:murein DD-endopeptidase MepM/ murein hydrolase activator NlpD